MDAPQSTLPNPPLYTPYRNGRFRITPDFHPLGTDLGAGLLDTHLIQWDTATARILQDKAVARAHRPVWFHTPDLDQHSAQAVADLLLTHRDRVAPIDAPCPDLPDDPGDQLAVLGNCIPEDFAITVRTPDGQDRVAGLHVSLPSRWDPAEKQSLSFAQTHAPVPGMNRISHVAMALMDSVRSKGPQVRFTWGIAFNPDYDQHPAKGHPPFDGDHFWIRIERQVLWPVENTDAFLFTIRLHVHPATALSRDPDAASGLASALRQMSPDERRYKGLAGDADRVAEWIEKRLPAWATSEHP